MFKRTIKELFMLKNVVCNHFWELIKNPENYTEEINFYVQEDLTDSSFGVKDIVVLMSELVKSEKIWKGK